jgi:hypothetical protein
MKLNISPGGTPRPRSLTAKSERIEPCSIAFARSPATLTGESRKMGWRGLHASGREPERDTPWRLFVLASG